MASTLAIAPSASAQTVADGDQIRVLSSSSDVYVGGTTKAAYDPTRNRFLIVVDIAESAPPFRFATSLVNADGTSIPGTITDTGITNGFTPNGHPIAEYNPTSDEFLVAWTQGVGGFFDPGARSAVLFGRRISAATGAAIGGLFEIQRFGPDFFCGPTAPTLAFNPATGGYVVAYSYAMRTLSGNDAQVRAACPGVNGTQRDVIRIGGLDRFGVSTGAPQIVPGTLGQATLPDLARNPVTGEFLLVTNTQNGTTIYQKTVAQRYSPTLVPLGSTIEVDVNTAGSGQAAYNSVTGGWMIATYTSDGGRQLRVHSFGADGARIGAPMLTRGAWNASELVAAGDGTFVLLDGSAPARLMRIGPDGTAIGEPIGGSGYSTVIAGAPGQPLLAFGYSNSVPGVVLGRRIVLGVGPVVSGSGIVVPGGRTCVSVAGAPGDVALVNLTPVEARGAGFGQLVASQIANPPVASMVNYTTGSVDPNVAAAPIGADGKVCYVNGAAAAVQIVADHLASVRGRVVTLASPTGAPVRVADTRIGLAGGIASPGGRVCFAVSGDAGDIALVNLTPVEASAPGFGQLVSSSIANPPVASNVNYTVGGVDPNVAAAPIGADGKVCYVNGASASVHLVADHLATIDASAVTLASPTGAPVRVADTRIGVAGGIAAPGGRVCFGVSGDAGDIALVNLTPVAASGPGFGQLVSSSIANPPVASNVNYTVGSVDPNVAAAPIGADGQVCYVNGASASVHLVADHLATIDVSAVTLASPTGAPFRRIDTRS